MTSFIKKDGSLAGEVVIATDARSGYRAAAQGVAPLSTITDWFAIIGGTGKILLPKRIGVSGFIATAAVAVDIYLVKRTALSTGQAVTAVASTPLDSLDPPAVGVAQSWAGGGPSSLGSGAVIGVQKIYLPVSPALPMQVVWDFTAMKPPVIRANEYLALSFSGQSWSNAMNLDVEAEWEEV